MWIIINYITGQTDSVVIVMNESGEPKTFLTYEMAFSWAVENLNWNYKIINILE